MQRTVRVSLKCPPSTAGVPPAYLCNPSSTSIRSSSSSSFFPVQPAPSSSLSASQSPPKPSSQLWYTARPSLNSTITDLTSAIASSRSYLFRSGLLSSIAVPLNAPDKEFRDVLQHPRLRRWMSPKEMATYLRTGTDLRSSQYKKLTSLLSNLEGLLPYAEVADALPNIRGPPVITMDPVAKATGKGDGQLIGGTSLHPQLAGLLARFEQARTVSASGVVVKRVIGVERRLGKMDTAGRVMAVGRRKESGARVWIVPVQSTEGGEDSIPGRVLINTRSLPEYFSLPAHRTAAILPLTLTSTLGSFNVFAIARGGGLAAQSEAIAMGLSRALVEWERCQVDAGKLVEGAQQWREVLKRASILERDPRMVERKKTGQLKARKKMAWVKR